VTHVLLSHPFWYVNNVMLKSLKQIDVKWLFVINIYVIEMFFRYSDYV
jgi:hypothetical protein